ncbi:hypothetical protein LTR78_004823 [Recurvomyces mirabilis]|uniref:Uncharacterized protein n=1 Tax=Recurvomyces mirabilis TaxID=574656 RepID=A0AAE0WP41_9PEZI|nr:hypothetical protein LTR78_004823 [Recurvomyces mirabilis]KAK5157993.1 hypothetical protein LTS14_003916 [Recurvomyces mirabilis]
MALLLRCLLSSQSWSEHFDISDKACEERQFQDLLRKRRKRKKENNASIEANDDLVPVIDTSASESDREGSDLHDKPNTTPARDDELSSLAEPAIKEPSSPKHKSVTRLTWLVSFLYAARHLALTLLLHNVTIWNNSNLNVASSSALATTLFVMGTVALLPLALVYRCVRAVRKYRAKVACNEAAPELGAMELVGETTGEVHEGRCQVVNVCFSSSARCQGGVADVGLSRSALLDQGMNIWPGYSCGHLQRV